MIERLRGNKTDVATGRSRQKPRLQEFWFRWVRARERFYDRAGGQFIPRAKSASWRRCLRRGHGI